ncbi:MAG: thiol reductant ABC exporter subunit CydC [Bacillota bacterium]|nr:thiol reductant ABC exporter subunit CydC [Bacillota bacterium]
MKRSGFEVMRRLVGLVRPLRGWMLIAITMGLLGHLAASGITVVGGHILITILRPETSSGVGVFFAVILVFALLRGVLRYAEQAANHYIAFKLLALLRDRVFGALRRLSPAKLQGKDRGNLISLITSDIELLEVFYAHTISPVAIAVLFGLLLVLLIGSCHVLLGLLAAFAYIIVGALIPLVTSRLSGDDGLSLRNKAGKLAAFVLDSLRGLSETLQYGQGQARLEGIRQRTSSLLQDERRMKLRGGLNRAVTNTIILIFDFAMFLLASRLCDFSGSLIATLALMSSFGPVVALADLGSTLQQTFAAGNRVLDILDEEPVVRDIHGREPIDFHGAAAEEVSFAYSEEEILRRISLDIPKSKIIGITGRSGSGKSTLLKLFMRFWQTDEGAIRISGRSVEEINTANLRELESYVTQETHLFHDSIRNNLLIAKLDASQEELEAACRQAAIHDFIQSLPQGYDTEVGELGDTLSGGERQRLGLARAFLHNAPFLLLDEPSSNLDSLNEALILKSLHEGRRGKTVLLVSHRRSTMGICDRSFSVEHGRVS